MHMDNDERLPLLTLDEAHDVIDALVHSASCGDDDAGRLARYLAARVPSRDCEQHLA